LTGLALLFCKGKVCAVEVDLTIAWQFAL